MRAKKRDQNEIDGEKERHEVARIAGEMLSEQKVGQDERQRCEERSRDDERRRRPLR